MIIESLIIQRNLLYYLYTAIPILKRIESLQEAVYYNGERIKNFRHFPQNNNKFVTMPDGLIALNLHTSQALAANIAVQRIFQDIDIQFKSDIAPYLKQTNLALNLLEDIYNNDQVILEDDTKTFLEIELSIFYGRLLMDSHMYLPKNIQEKMRIFANERTELYNQNLIKQSKVSKNDYEESYLLKKEYQTHIDNLRKTGIDIQNSFINDTNKEIPLFKTVMNKGIKLHVEYTLDELSEFEGTQLEINKNFKAIIDSTYNWFTTKIKSNIIDELKALYKKNYSKPLLVSVEVDQYITRHTKPTFHPPAILDYSFLKPFLQKSPQNIPAPTPSIAPKPSPLLEGVLQEKQTPKTKFHQITGSIPEEKIELIEESTSAEEKFSKEPIIQQQLSDFGYEKIPWCYADRVIAWFKDEDKRKNETTWDCLYHSFPIIVDQFLYNIGIETKETTKPTDRSYSLAGKVSYHNNSIIKDVIYTVTVDNKKVCYHRGITQKDYQVIADEFFKESKWNIDFPPLTQEKSQCAVTDFDPTGKIIVNDNFHTIIQDDLNNATITLYKPITLK